MRLAHVLFGLYVVVCLAALTWPVFFATGNRIEPYVLGLPFSLAWNVGWVLLSFAVLALFHTVTTRGEDP